MTAKNHIGHQIRSRPAKAAINWTLIVFEVARTPKSNPKQCIGGQRGTKVCSNKYISR